MRIHASWIVRVTCALLLAGGAGEVASADTVTASYLSAGTQVPATASYETFNSLPTGSGSGFSTTFNGSGYTGTYTGGITITPADVFGGAGGTGAYPTALGAGATYTLTLDHGANYLGLWLSAVDPANLLQFYNGSSLVYSFTPTELSAALGGCPGSAFCGNPNGGGNTAQQYVYLNFYDSTGIFDRIVFTEADSGGLESDNHTVGMLSAPPAGTPINPTPIPEPASVVLLLTGMAAVVGRRLLPSA